MSELRQRKDQGAKPKPEPKEEAEGGQEGELSKEERNKKAVEDIIEAMKNSAPVQSKGLSKEATVFKDQLKDDPFNMDLIFKLGQTYGHDNQWGRCMNVMLRGWKRVQEFEDVGLKFEFLCLLAQASHKEGKHRQALAVLQDIDEPQSEVDKAFLELLRCQVYCDNGDAQRGLQSFNRAIEGQDFERAATLWATCLAPLKRAGAYDVSRSTMLAMARNQKDRDKLEATEHLIMLRDTYHAPKPNLISTMGGKIVMGILMVCIGYSMYVFESTSLSKLKT